MNQILQKFGGMPKPVQAGLLLAVGGGTVGAIALFDRRALVAIAIGMVIVGILLALYNGLLRQMQKRKAAPMERAIASNTSAAPVGISEPAKRARLDDLRKNFESGVEKFRAAGKDLYSLPWYALVGEPGSGKTEAIRHCNVGFPPGLQDQLQGAGGTLNMNWWFTNHAIIIDTAGRLMFEEVEPGTTSEWQEFLKLLRKSRPNCPINGMLLVIPAESLIRDTADALERKGGKIAAQLDQIQRALGVRFPVFVVITKCDLINGFREFFDDLTDPQLQHQILGWSNPANLDQPFNPELVDEHLRTVQQRLVRRRLGLLLDPVHTEDPKARRTDQVDALYAFPESLMKIAPRLRRYLEMIFVAGEWSSKPLFLRGIYFTSSMREGSALDADLAEALGVPVENLPEGRVWERERAYFLRDLFMNKVFREKGLVTRAVNTTAQQRSRRRIVYGTAAAGLLVIGGLTWQGATALRDTIVGPSMFWTGATKAYKVDVDDASKSEGTSEHYLPVVRKLIPSDEDFKYLGDPGVEAEPLKDLPVSEKERRTRALFPLELKEQAARPIKTPWVFVPVAAVTGDHPRDLLGDERRRAARVLFEASVLRPLVDAAKVRIKHDAAREDRSWPPEATGALTQLVRLEIAGLPGNTKAGGFEIDPLLKYALLGNDGYVAEGASKDAPQMQQVMEWLYSADADKGHGEWPPASLRESNIETISHGIDAFNRSWATQTEGGGGGGGDLAKLIGLAGALREFGEAEKRLQAVDDDPGRDPALALKEWGERLAALNRAAAGIEAGTGALKGRPLARAFDEEMTAFRGKLAESYTKLLKELDSVSPATGAPDAARAQTLIDKRKALVDARDQLMKDSEGVAKARADALRLDALYIVSATEPVYGARLAAYKAADERLKAGSAAPGAEPGALRAALKALDDGLRADSQKIQDDLKTRPGADPVSTEFNDCVSQARGVSTFVLGLAGQGGRAALIGAFVDHAAATPEALADAVTAYANAKGLVPERPKVPMTARRDKFDAKYAPKAAAAVVGDYEAARNALRAATGTPAGSAGAVSGVQGAAQLSQRYSRAAAAMDGYIRQYAEYWSDKVSDELAVEARPTWADFVAELGRNNRASAYKDELVKAQKAVEEAGQVMSAVIERDPADQSRTAALERLSRLGAQARTTLENASMETRCDKFLSSWFALGPETRGAGARLLSKIETAAGVREYFDVLPQGDLKDADLVQRFWRDLTLKAVRTLASEATVQAADAAEDLLKRKARFPLGPAGKGEELTPAEIAQARESYMRVRAALGGSAGSDNWTPDAEINEELRKLSGRGLVKATDEDAIKHMGAMLDALPAAEGEKIACTVVALNTHTLDQGQVHINEPAPYARIGVGGRIVGLRGADAELGQLPLPGEQTTIQFVRKPENDAAQLVVAELPIPSRWGAIYLVDKYKGTPAAGGSGRRWWDVPVEVMSEGRRYNLWIRIQFDRDLPEPAMWPR